MLLFNHWSYCDANNFFNTMTTKESHNYLTFYSLCNFMQDFIEDKWARNSSNVRKVKLLSNQLKGELEKSVDHVFTNKDTEGVDMGNVLEQFVQASYIMEFFFKVGLHMDELQADQKDKLNKEMNELLAQYGINLNVEING